MTHVDELVLRTRVLQFDGRVVEIFGGPDAIRRHVALMKEPRVDGPNRKGRMTVFIANTTFSVNADETEEFWPLLYRISAAIAACRAEGGAAD
jgi:hypothetical protein